MSPRRRLLAAPVVGLVPRIGKSLSAWTELSWPSMRICTLALLASMTPALSTAFCALSCETTWLKSRPSSARRFCEISMNSFSACTPKRSTLATSGTRSSSERTASACWRSSSIEKPPSEDSAKMEP